jgi:hypothetical protein
MVELKQGRSLRLSLQRRLVCDLLHFARQVPSVPVQRQMKLREVVRARRCCLERPSWVAIFAKAFGLVAAEQASLRRAYLRFPTGHLYEHPQSVASIAMSREYQGEQAVFFVRLRGPERQDIDDLDSHLRRYKNSALDRISAVRRALRITRMPRPLRRLAWWYGLNVSGSRRARLFGTFGISAYSSLGVESLHPIAPLTTVLNYGPIAADGTVAVRLIYDHRVLDGAEVGKGLCRLEEIMFEVITKELNTLPRLKPSGLIGVARGIRHGKG